MAKKTPKSVALAEREKLLEKERIYSGIIQGYYNVAKSAIEGDLIDVRDRLDHEIANGVLPQDTTAFANRIRLSNLLSEIEQQIQKFSDKVMSDTEDRAKDAIVSGVKNAEDQIVLGGSFDRLPTESLEALVSYYDDKPLTRKYGFVGREKKQEVREVLFTSLAKTQNPRTAITDVSTTLDSSRFDAENIARTTVIGASRAGQIKVYQHNTDILEGWRWLCPKNARTCPMCLAMDGTLHKAGDPFSTHPQCRCTTVAVLEGLEDLQDFGDTGEEWFNKQDHSMKVKILGPVGAKLVADGKLNLKDFVHEFEDPDYGLTRNVKSFRKMVQEGILTKKDLSEAFNSTRSKN